MKAKNNETPKKFYKRSLLPLIIVILMLGMGALAVWVSILNRQVNQLSANHFGNLVVDAVDALKHDIPADPRTGELFIHQERLVLPYTDNPDINLSYSYLSQNEEADAELRVADKSTVGPARIRVMSAPSMNDIFRVLPKLQACARGYLMSFKQLENPQDIALAFVKDLKDGRKLYVYVEDQCRDNSTTIVPYLQQIESY